MSQFFGEDFEQLLISEKVSKDETSVGEMDTPTSFLELSTCASPTQLTGACRTITPTNATSLLSETRELSFASPNVLDLSQRSIQQKDILPILQLQSSVKEEDTQSFNHENYNDNEINASNSIVELLENMKNKLKLLDKEKEELRNKNDHFFVNHFRCMQEHAIYRKELEYLQDHQLSEKSNIETNQDIMRKMNRLCDDTISSMETVYNCLLSCSIQEKRVNPAMATFIKEKTNEILHNDRNDDYVLEGCDANKRLDDSSSLISDDQVLDVISHVISSGKMNSAFENDDEVFYSDDSIENEIVQALLKQVTSETFYRIKNFLHTKIHVFMLEASKNKFAYIQTRNPSFSVEDLEIVADMLEIDINPLEVIELRTMTPDKGSRHNDDDLAGLKNLSTKTLKKRFMKMVTRKQHYTRSKFSRRSNKLLKFKNLSRPRNHF